MKWTVTVPIFASAIFTVEADSFEEAEKIADECVISNSIPSLCHQCADEVEIHDIDWSSKFDVSESGAG